MAVDQYYQQIQDLVESIRNNTEPPSDLYICPRCRNKSLQIIFTLRPNGTMGVNVRCTVCDPKMRMHFRYAASQVPIWLKRSIEE